MDKLDNINWFGHASFSFVDKNGNRIYYIDPIELNIENAEKADIVFITHAHSDHFSPEDINKILKDETFIIAPLGVLDDLNFEWERKIGVVPNKKYEVNNFIFQTFPAYNSNFLRANFHPKKNNWVGYIFEINGKKIYHAGDTDFIEEMEELKDLNLDIAMLPIGGTYTMDSDEAARAANTIRAKITIPMHYKRLLGDNYKDAENNFKKLVKKSKVVILDELK